MDTLENLVKNLHNGERNMKGMKKIMVAGDYHVPFMDEKAFSCMLSYAKKYKPDEFIVNGDLVDFYSLSFFDKNPDRKVKIEEEIDLGKKVLADIRKAVGKKCKMTFTEGNHEARLQRYLWKNRELYGMNVLKIDSLLDLKNQKIGFVGGSMDYWKNDNGHYKVADVLIMHGDNRMNGASCSAYSGYSAKGTVQKLNSSIIMGHCHRGATIYHKTPNKTFVGMEGGCLCEHSGTANWQQGFITFETKGKVSMNHRFHHIRNGIHVEDGKVYK